jgi:hypothetical protein
MLLQGCCVTPDFLFPLKIQSIKSKAYKSLIATTRADVHTPRIFSYIRES